MSRGIEQTAMPYLVLFALVCGTVTLAICAIFALGRAMDQEYRSGHCVKASGVCTQAP